MKKTFNTFIYTAFFHLFIVTLFSQNLTYEIKNDGISRIVSIGKYVETIKITNLYTEQSYDVISDEFRIMIDDYKADFSGIVLDNKSFQLDGEAEYTKGKKLNIPLINKEYGLRVIIHYEADGRFYIHKWLEFETLNKDRNISVVEVERMIFKGANPYHPMPEQDGNTPNDGPVFLNNLFFGLEFPKQDNSFDGDYLRFRHFPGKTISPGQNLISKKVVIGSSPDKPLHRLKDSFFEYIGEYRKTPVRNFKVYNTWFLLVFDQTEEKLLNAIDTHVKPLYERGIKLDGFVVDDGWQDKNTLWEVNREMIPDGLGPDSKIQRELKKYECNLHLWMPLSGQYGLAKRRGETEWYEKHGYETGINWSLCLAPGNKIFNDKKQRIIDLVKQGVTSFKADFAFLGCDKKGHHHLPNKYYGMEANVEGVLDIIRSIRKINPDIFYYLTTSINKSPWWLETNDVLWESRGGDIKIYSGNGEPTDAIRRMSGRDEWHYKNTLHWFVPETSYMTHGIIGGNTDYNGLYCSLQDFIDNAILYYARGIMWSEIYVTTMDDAYWKALTDVIKWSDKNWEILTKQPFLSGGPSDKKPYYWSHFKGDNGVIVLRNPTAYERGISIPLNETSRLAENAGQKYKAEVVKVTELSNVFPRVLGYYEYNDNITTTLKPWEVLALQITPVRDAGDIPQLSVSDIDFGVLSAGIKVDTTISISNSLSNVSLLNADASGWISLHREEKNTYKISVNTENLEYSTTYQTILRVESESEPYDRDVVVFFQTGVNPNAKELYLSDIDFKSHKQGWGSLGKDKSVSGNELTIAGKKFSKGLGAHSEAETVYLLKNLNVKRFQSFVGQDDETSGTIQFRVFVDEGKGFSDAVFDSGVMKKGDAAKFVDIDISGAKKIKLSVGNGGDNINGDHADWADAKFIR